MSFYDIFDLTAEVFSNIHFRIFTVLNQCALFFTIVGLMQEYVPSQWGVLSARQTCLPLFCRVFLTGNYATGIAGDMLFSI